MAPEIASPSIAQRMKFAVIALFLLALASAFLLQRVDAAPPSGGYVGFTVPLSPPNFITCQPTYNNPFLPPGNTGVVANQVNACVVRGNPRNSALSGYHFVIKHNNNNGTVAIPANQVIAQKVSFDYRYTMICGGPVFTATASYIEYFQTDAPPSQAQAKVDNQGHYECCESEDQPGTTHTVELEAAIVPLGNNWPAVPPGQSAVMVPMTAAAQKAFEAQTFGPNVTLKMHWDYTYDNCNRPPHLPDAQCATPNPPFNHHDLRFESATFDPPAVAPTWPAAPAPTVYCSR